MGAFKSLSYSKYADYKLCPAMCKALHIDKVPREESDALKRGIAVHEQAEKYLKDRERGELLSDWFVSKLDELTQASKLVLEQLWGLDWSFQPSRYGPIWMKLDALAFLTDDQTECLVVDYKTGRKNGNEIKHMEQGQVYALGVFRKFPEVKVVDTVFWYVDHDCEGVEKTYTREEDEHRLYMKWRERFQNMDSDPHFDPKAGWWCRYCPVNSECPANQ